MNPIQSFGKFLPLLALILPTTIHAGTLGSATLAAWDDYIQSTTALNERRSSSENRFLWIDESPERIAKVRAGEIMVSQTAAETPKRVPSGMIHDWVGAVFIPNASLNDVFRVVRNYPRYKEWFQPAVADSRLIASAETEDRFSMLLVNRSFFKKMALDTEYESRYFSTNEHCGYSVAWTTRIREVEEYRAPGQRVLPEGEGSGTIWRLFSITRYAERDGGVYVEVQAIGLSRDIPASLRWMVEPIVRRVSRASLSTSLRQMAAAVQANLNSTEMTSRSTPAGMRAQP